MTKQEQIALLISRCVLKGTPAKAAANQIARVISQSELADMFKEQMSSAYQKAQTND